MTASGVLLKGTALGLGAAVPIGPVNVEIARRTLRHGFRAGFALGCGAVSVDIVYAVLSSFGVGPLLDHPLIRRPLAVIGLAWLGGLGVLCMISAWQHARSDPVATARPAGSVKNAYFTGLAMTISNPMTLAFWFVVVPGVVGSITQEAARNLPMICAGVFLGTMGWVIVFSGFLGLAGRYRRRWWLAAADAVGGVTLLGFMAGGIWHAFQRGL